MLRVCGLKASPSCELKSWAIHSRRLEASAASWEDHTGKPSTHVLTPPKIGALGEVAHDNIARFGLCSAMQKNIPYYHELLLKEIYCRDLL